MKIAVNTRLLLKDKMEGIGWFTYETLRRITNAQPEIEFIFIFDRKPSEDFIFSDNVTAVVAHPQARHPFLWYLFFEFGVARVLKKYKPDLFLSPDGWLSLRSNTPQLAVIHDLNFEKHPEFLIPIVHKYYKYFFPRFARKAKRLATVSNYTKKDLIERYGIDASKIDVVYNGVNDLFQPLSQSEIVRVREFFSDGKPYLLFVGLIHPRKNLKNQVKAFLQVKSETKCDLKYLVVGSRYMWDKEIDEILKTSEYGKDVVFLGRQGLDTLTKLYGGAFALTYASYFEGFGIPIIEAMKSGIPVITSNTSSMPEIAGKHALIVDPNSVNEIRNAIVNLLEDESLRRTLIDGGVKQVEQFTWEQSAQSLYSSIQRCLKD
jgi:glycosyltransferase involved in cell wall biosynthesis